MRWQVSKNTRSGPLGVGHYGVSSGGAFVAAPRVLNITPEACKSPYPEVACLEVGGERVSFGDVDKAFQMAWRTEAEKVIGHDTMGPLLSEALNTGHVSPNAARAWMRKSNLDTSPAEVFQTIARAENKWRRVKALAKQRAEKNLGRLLPWTGLSDLLFEIGFDAALVKGFKGVPNGRIVTHEAFEGTESVGGRRSASGNFSRAAAGVGPAAAVLNWGQYSLRREASKKLRRKLKENYAIVQPALDLDPGGGKGYASWLLKLVQNPDLTVDDLKTANDAIVRLNQVLNDARAHSELASVDPTMEALHEYESKVLADDETNPRFRVIAPNIVETVNFIGACQLHGTKAPASRQMPWCGGKSRGHFQSYAENGRRRYLVFPKGATETVNLGGQEVPWSNYAFTISVRNNGRLGNINDPKNLYPHDGGFDAAGAERALSILDDALGLDLASGFEAVSEWDNIGLNQEEWEAQGFDFEDAEYWAIHEFSDAEEAKRWRDLGFSALDAQQWVNEDFPDLDDAGWEAFDKLRKAVPGVLEAWTEFRSGSSSLGDAGTYPIKQAAQIADDEEVRGSALALAVEGALDEEIALPILVYLADNYGFSGAGADQTTQIIKEYQGLFDEFVDALDDPVDSLKAYWEAGVLPSEAREWLQLQTGQADDKLARLELPTEAGAEGVELAEIAEFWDYEVAAVWADAARAALEAGLDVPDTIEGVLGAVRQFDSRLGIFLDKAPVALQWMDALRSRKVDLYPTSAQPWIARGISPDQAMPWLEAGWGSAGQVAADYHRAGETPAQYGKFDNDVHSYMKFRNSYGHQISYAQAKSELDQIQQAHAEQEGGPANYADLRPIFDHFKHLSFPDLLRVFQGSFEERQLHAPLGKSQIPGYQIVTGKQGGTTVDYWDKYETALKMLQGHPNGYQHDPEAAKGPAVSWARGPNTKEEMVAELQKLLDETPGAAASY